MLNGLKIKDKYSSSFKESLCIVTVVAGLSAGDQFLMQFDQKDASQ